MPEAAYRVARSVARRLVESERLTPPFDVESLTRRHAVLLDEAIPTHADVITLHSAHAGDQPVIVIDQGLSQLPERRRFAISHGLGHVLLGWHPLGMPCDVSTQPHELPVRMHDLLEGEAHAFARELLMPSSWVVSLGGLSLPAQLIRVVAERAGTSIMSAARAVALQLPHGFTWVVSDQWDRVLDAGRSPGTSITMPMPGDELEPARFARHAAERHRDQHGDLTIHVWRIDPAALDRVPHELRARELATQMARELEPPMDEIDLLARLDGIAGWANAQPETASLDGMARALAERARTTPELARIMADPRATQLLQAKATELVAKRLAR